MGVSLWKYKTRWGEKWKLLREKSPEEYKKLLAELQLSEEQTMTCRHIQLTKVPIYYRLVVEKIDELNS